MQYIRLLRMTVLLLLAVTSASCYIVRYDGPYKGKVIDAETGKPIEGVVVLGVWYEEIATVAGGVSSYYDADETVTNKDGEFQIKGKGLRMLTNIGPMNVLIFKSSYQYIDGPWESLKIDGGLMEKKIAWEGDRAIIPIRRLTMEEREKYGSPSRPSIPHGKMKILTKEINTEEVYLGRPPYPEEE